MQKREAPLDVSSDVLHIPSQTKLTAEEIAKAIAHHKRHHHGQPAGRGKTAQKTAPGKKQR